MLLYGREIRLPAQLHDADAGSAELTGVPLEDPTALSGDCHSEYALNLHRCLVYAWRAARDHTTRIRQGETVSDTVAKSAPPTPFVVGDRVARR
eukprot:229951-Prymnesium_polylepis.1